MFVLAGTGSNVHIWPLEDDLNSPTNEKLVEKLESFEANSTKFKIVFKTDMPESLHFKNSIRCPPIMLVAEPHYEFIDKEGKGGGVILPHFSY